MDRRRFLKYASAAAAVVGASAVGLDSLLAPKSIQTRTTSTGTFMQSTLAISTQSPVPSVPTRLLATQSDFQRVWEQVQSDSLANSMYGTVKTIADTTLYEKPYQFTVQRESGLLSISRRVVKRIYALGVTYHLTGDHRYVDRAWSELETATQFPDWNPDQFLSTAEMCHAFAVGYDWFPWTPDQKKTLRDAMVEKGLQPALESYRKNSQVWTTRDGWVNADHNWNQVCNGGIGVAALSLLPDLPDLSNQVLKYALNSIRSSMASYAPDGGWIEGPVYWNYGTFYNCVFLAALEKSQVGDAQLSDSEPFSSTGLFPIYMTGPTSHTFNFADTESDLALTSPQMLWLAQRFHKAEYAWYARTNGDFQCSPACDGDYVCPGPCVGLMLGLLWFTPEARDPISANLPLDKYFSKVEAVSMRSGWNDSDALFLGMKAGYNDANHAHLDNGSFVVQALGQKWAIDLGADDYNLPSFGCRRCYYYRYRAEGHNTLVFNPSKDPDQGLEGYGRITKFQPSPQRPFAIANLTPAYSNYATVRRGIALPDRNQVIIQDEIQSKQPVDLWWFMHTPASIELHGQTAILSQGNTRLWCAIASPQTAEFTAMDAKPLPSSPNPAGQDSNYGIRKLAIHQFTGLNPFTLAVIMVPLKPEDQVPTTPLPIVPLANW